MDISVTEIAPRKAELQGKLKNTCERHKAAFERDLTPEMVREYLAFCELKETRDFIESKLGFMYSKDRVFIEEILNDVESKANKAKAKAKAKSKSKQGAKPSGD